MGNFNYVPDSSTLFYFKSVLLTLQLEKRDMMGNLLARKKSNYNTNLICRENGKFKGDFKGHTQLHV